MNSVTHIPYSTLVQQFEQAPPGKLFCVHGDPSVFRLSLYAASHALLRGVPARRSAAFRHTGVPVALVDGTNRFDAYYIAEFARQVTSQTRKRVTSEELLKRIYIARAFTCYQMEATITERLPAFLKRSGAPIAIIFGLLDTFYDEQAPLFEVKASVERIIAALRQLKTDNISVLLASLDMKLESKERNMLFPRVSSAMDHVASVTEGPEGLRLVPDHNFIIRHSRFDIQYSQKTLPGGSYHGRPQV
jgi:hypothetical protein